MNDEEYFKELVPQDSLDNDLDAIPKDITPEQLLEQVSSIIDQKPVGSITSKDLKDRAGKITMINNEMFYKYGVSQAWKNIITLQNQIDATIKEIETTESLKIMVEDSQLVNIDPAGFDNYLETIGKVLPKLRRELSELLVKQSDLMNKLGIKENVSKSVMVQVNNNIPLANLKPKKQNVIPAGITPNL